MNYLIIGGVAGGATVAARLRRMDEKANIILFERGKYVSYASQYRFDIFKGIGCEGSYIGLSIHCQTLRRRAETKCFCLRLFVYE